jgi:hypothetical protein
MKGHPTSQGWTALQTYRTPQLTRMVCARYLDRKLVLSFWKYDNKANDAGASVDWEMTREIILEHHAVAALNTVYLDGMRNQLDALALSPAKEASRS